MKRIFEKINFRQPKYMLPAILYIPLLGASYLVFDLFNVEKAEIPDNTLQATEFLNPELPDATIKGGDGIGSKYENMAKSWGKIADYNTSRGTARTKLPSWASRNSRNCRQGNLPMSRRKSGKPSKSWSEPLPGHD